MGVALLCLFVLLKAFALLLVFTVRTGISPVPTTPRVASAMFDLIPAGSRGVIYELGSGWGSLARGLAKRFPAASVVAYELSPLPWLFSRLWQRLAPRANLTIHLADFQNIGLDDAAVVCCYLYPGAMRRLAEKFERELADGALVVSNSFLVPGWVPAAVRRAEDQYGSPVYLYRMPPDLEPAPDRDGP